MNKPKRGRGRPKITGSEPVATEENLAIIEDMYLKSRSWREIAERLGCSIATVRYWLDNKIRPEWKARRQNEREDVIKEVEKIKEVAWEEFEKSLVLGGFKIADLIGVQGVLDQLKIGQVKVAQVLNKLRKSGDKGWLSVILMCLDWQCKVGGYYAAQKIESELTLRVAGSSNKELEQKVLERLADRLRAREQSANPN
jgi:hypothetical protein